MFGEYGCLPLVAYGKTKTSSAFKLLARARNLDFEIANTISKQIQVYELDKKHAIENNADDPDYNVDDDIILEDYIDPQYLPLVNESKKYQGIILNISPQVMGSYNGDVIWEHSEPIHIGCHIINMANGED